MPAWFKPDPAAEIGKLKREVEELSRIVRRGKPAANMRDLADGNLSKATDGQVPVYNAASGKWKPGSAGGGPLTARVEFPMGSVAQGSEVTAVSWTVLDDDIGLTLNPSTGAIAVPSAGTVIATAWAGWAANAAGSRLLRLNGYWTLSYDERQAVAVAGRVTRQPATIIEHHPASQIADAMSVAVGHFGTGASVDVTVRLSVAFWAA